MERSELPDTLSLILVAMLFVLDALVWRRLIFLGPPNTTHAYFLDVGQGDAEMIVFPRGMKVLTDAGPDDKVLQSIPGALAPGDTYIDLAVISHPQLDHFNGFNFLLDHYSFGAFIYNGRDDGPTVKEWPALLAKLRAKHIPLLTLGAGDTLHFGPDEIEVLSPNHDFGQSAELNDTAFMELVKTKNMRVLLTADTGANVEDFLVAKGTDLRADILKVGHHGSRFSSSPEFLRAVAPQLAVIEVGAKNRYGHPARDTLARLAACTKALVLRTDRNGTVEAWMENGKLKVRKEKG